ncbi:hypothetical protein DFH06DRAFT_1333936 [Mycena polygramma]|nr:hypothetical protein DFH06DRAFT_1333936 [Mycena polygramma]
MQLLKPVLVYISGRTPQYGSALPMPLSEAQLSIDLGEFAYGHHFAATSERRQDRHDGPHSFHVTYILSNGGPFEALIVGMLKGIVPLNEHDTLLVLGPASDSEETVKKFQEIQDTLDYIVQHDNSTAPRTLLSNFMWSQKDTIFVTVSTLTVKTQTAIGGHVTSDFCGIARAGEIMRCNVVLQREDKCRASEAKCVEVFDRTYRLKANRTERIYDATHVLNF